MIQAIKKFLFVNSSAKQTIAKNTFWLLFAEFINKWGVFVLMLIIAQQVGPEQFWTMSYIISYVSLWIIVVDYWLAQIVVREISKEPEKTTTYYFHGMLLKTILGVVNFLLVTAVSYLLSHEHLSVYLLMLYCGYAIITNIGEYSRIIFRPKEQMEHEAYIKIATWILFFVFVWVATLYWWDITSIFFSFLIAAICNLLISLVYIFHHIEFRRLEFSLDRWLLGNFLKKWSLLAVSIFFVNIIINIDQFLLWYHGLTYDLGIYALGYKMTFIYTVIFAMFFQTLLPRVSKNPSKELYSRWLQRVTWINGALLVLYVSFTYFIYRQPYRDIGPYKTSLLVFLSLLLYCVFESYGHRGYIHLIALRKEKLIVAMFAFCALLNVIANSILIPLYSYTWAIVVTVATYLLYGVISHFFVRYSYSQDSSSI